MPLWMALMLHKRRKCRINPPEWLAVAQLEGVHSPVNVLHNPFTKDRLPGAHSYAGVLEDERNRPETFQELPLHYMEIAHLLFTYAKDSFGADLVQVTLTRMLQKLSQVSASRGMRQNASHGIPIF